MNIKPGHQNLPWRSEAFHVAMFEKAIDMLRSEETKPASMFGSAKISPNDIEQITAFLQEVAKQIADGEHHDRSRSPSPESRLIVGGSSRKGNQRPHGRRQSFVETGSA